MFCVYFRAIVPKGPVPFGSQAFPVQFS